VIKKKKKKKRSRIGLVDPCLVAKKVKKYLGDIWNFFFKKKKKN